jgi:aspartate carbamoyltransferase catalytic subunit
VAPRSALHLSSQGQPQGVGGEDDAAPAEEARRALKFDVCYVTRLQGERLAPGQKSNPDYPVIDSKFLRGRRYRDTRVLHPLPRVNELSYDLDDDPRGIYFKQAAYGVPIRMALIAKILGLDPFRSAPGPAAGKVYGHAGGLTCPNARCITHHPSEQAHLAPKFRFIRSTRPTARCFYCETDIEIACYVDLSARALSTNFERLDSIPPSDVLFFITEQDARNSGFTQHRD